MPHINIKCYKGRSEEELKKIAQQIAESAAVAFGAKPGSISVSIEPVDKEEWKSIYDNEIYGKKDNLYVEPGYKM